MNIDPGNGPKASHYVSVVHLSIIAAVGLLIYSNIFRVPFQFDDYYYIEYNPAMRDFGYFMEPSRIDRLIDNNGLNTYVHFKNRIFGYLTFFLNYRIHGSRVPGYHVVNLALHLFNACLVYGAISLILKTPALRGSPSEGSARAIPFFSALLFVSHPIQTQAVTYISQRFTSLAAFFCLVALVGYMASRLSESRRSTSCLYFAALVAAVLAMKSKENAFTLPFLILLSELAFFHSSAKKRIALLLPFFLASLIIPLSIIDFGGHWRDALGGASRTQLDISRSDYFVTQFRVIATYLRLLLLPVNQNLDYDYPLSDSFFDPRIILSFSCLLIVVGYCCYLLRTPGRRRRELLLIPYGILWFFVMLSLESGPIPLADLINEHRLYLPSVGIFVSLAALLAVIMRGRGAVPGVRGGLVAAIVLLSVVFSTLTYLRNSAWESPRTLWKDITVKSPDKARGFYNLGVAYKEEGRIDAAIQYHRMALMRKPTDIDALNGLGILYAAMGLTDKAEECYRRALAVRPNFPDAHFNLGLLYLDKGLSDAARMEFVITLTVDPGHRKARRFLDYISGPE